MWKLSNWIKKNILNEKQTENKERNEDNIVKENKNEERISKIKEEKIKEEIYINHMDTLFWEAGLLVTKKEKTSVGMLQRCFKIGLNRATRIMDELHEAGIVGEEIGTATRKVLIGQYELEELQYNDLIKVRGNAKTEDRTETKDKNVEKSICTVKEIETILRVSFGIDADYSNDGRTLETFKNYIVPSVSSENQTEIIDTLLKYNSPITMRMILLDDSIINYSPYNAVPHMLIPVITNEGKYDGVMGWCYAEMQDRINKFVENRVKNIDSYNRKMISTGGKTYPKIILVVNEISVFLKCATTLSEKILLNCNMTGIYFIMFSRFSMKNLSLGKLSELFEIYTFYKLKTLLSRGMKGESEQITKINYDDMNGYQFEQFCAYILSKNGFENIELTQGSGDHGIDILAEKGDITYAIQCKCYSSNIGNAAVQQAHTGKSLYHKDIAVVITNRYFTAQAIEEADALGVKLWDRDYLHNFVNAVSGIYDVKNKKPREKELNKILLDVAKKISDVFKSSQINAIIIDIDYKENETSFLVQPPQGIGIETIFLCKKEIEFELKIPIQIRKVSEKAYIGIYISSKDLCEYAMGNKTEEETESQNVPDSIIEGNYYIRGDFTTFSLKNGNKIEILAICENRINAANLYLSYAVKLKEEWIGNVDFSVAVNFGNAIAICTNENGVEFFGGKEIDGEIAIGIPKWMDKARDELLSGNKEEFSRMVEEASRYLDEFMLEAIKYIK